MIQSPSASPRGHPHGCNWPAGLPPGGWKPPQVPPPPGRGSTYGRPASLRGSFHAAHQPLPRRLPLARAECPAKGKRHGLEREGAAGRRPLGGREPRPLRQFPQGPDDAGAASLGRGLGPPKAIAPPTARVLRRADSDGPAILEGPPPAPVEGGGVREGGGPVVRGGGRAGRGWARRPVPPTSPHPSALGRLAPGRTSASSPRGGRRRNAACST